MDIYLPLKALHVAAALVFAGGLLAGSLAVAACPPSCGRRPPEIPAMLKFMGRWDQRITAPALLIVWAAGLAVAIRGGWFGSPWLTIKLAAVLFLSALHGAVSGTLRRLGRDDSVHRVPALLRHAAPAAVICLLLISILAVAKPF
jgi:uncharacterized membrane protein